MWVSRILTASLEMVLPGLGGAWVDSKLGSAPALTVLGLIFGLVLGVWHLLVMTRPKRPPTNDP